MLLDRECPRCGAAAGIKCRDLRRPRKTAPREHVARGWLDRPCSACQAQPGERCITPTGRQANTAHRARWEQPRLASQRYGYMWVAPGERDLEQPQRDALTTAGCARIWADRPLPIHLDAPAERGQLLAYLQPRDVLVTWRLDRLARTASSIRTGPSGSASSASRSSRARAISASAGRDRQPVQHGRRRRPSAIRALRG